MVMLNISQYNESSKIITCSNSLGNQPLISLIALKEVHNLYRIGGKVLNYIDDHEREKNKRKIHVLEDRKGETVLDHLKGKEAVSVSSELTEQTLGAMSSERMSKGSMKIQSGGSISGSSTRTTSLSEACSSPETLVSQEEDDDADGFKKNLKTLMKALKMKDQPPNVSSPEEFMVFDSFEVKVIPGTKEYQDKKTYKLSSGLRRGKAMIINFDTFEGTDYPPREGSQKDVVNLRALFSQLGKYNNHNNHSIALLLLLTLLIKMFTFLYTQ